MDIRSKVMKLKIHDQDMRDILIYAFRYSLNRMSMAPYTIRTTILDNLDNLKEIDLKIIKREIDEAVENHLAGDVRVDEPEWAKLSKVIEEKLGEE
jgi:hypothetical protein